MCRRSTLLKATVLMAMYSIRSERAFCERLNYDLLFKWFLDLPHRSGRRSTRRRSRRTVSDCWTTRSRIGSSPWWCAQAKLRRYVSSDHFSVDGTLLNAWASAQELPAQRSTRGWPAATGATRGSLARRAPLQRRARVDD